jgi:hypothetical protein
MNAMPCPACKGTRYQYGTSPVDVLSDLYSPMMLAGMVTHNWGLIIRGSGGFIGFFKAFNEQVNNGVQTNPLLRCSGCNNLIIVCPHCEEYLLLESRPKVDDKIKCSKCQFIFMTSERSDSFDKIISR